MAIQYMGNYALATSTKLRCGKHFFSYKWFICLKSGIS